MILIDDAPQRPPAGHRSDRWPRRAADGRLLGGVAAGVAAWLELSPWIVRAVLVVGALAWPPAVLAYALVWLAVPTGAGFRLLSAWRQPAGVRELAGAGVAVGVGLLVVPDLWPPRGSGALIGTGLAAVGAALLALPRQPVASRIRHPRPTPLLTPLTLVLLAAMAGFVLYQQLRGQPTSLAGMSSLAMVVVGGVLTISARRGRARGLLLLAPPLIVAWTAFVLTDLRLYRGAGARHYEVTGMASHELGVGELVVDVEHAALAESGAAGPMILASDISLSISAGVVRVRVPADAALEVRGPLGLAEIQIWDHRAGARLVSATGILANHDVNERWPALEGAGSGGQVVRLWLTVGLGRVEIHRV